MSILDYEFSDEQVYSVLSVNPDDQHIWLNISDELEIHLTKDDAYAIAKHFGLIDDWVSVHDSRPSYGVPVLLQINGIVQKITYNLDGSDDSLDWFEPYSTLGVYDDLNDMAFFVTHDIDVKWKKLPKEQAK